MTEPGSIPLWRTPLEDSGSVMIETDRYQRMQNVIDRARDAVDTEDDLEDAVVYLRLALRRLDHPDRE